MSPITTLVVYAPSFSLNARMCSLETVWRRLRARRLKVAVIFISGEVFRAAVSLESLVRGNCSPVSVMARLFGKPSSQEAAEVAETVPRAASSFSLSPSHVCSVVYRRVGAMTFGDASGEETRWTEAKS